MAVFGSEKEAGSSFRIDQLDSYGALDTAAARARNPTSELARITSEFLEFLGPSEAAGWSNLLLKSVIDATVFDLPAE